MPVAFLYYKLTKRRGGAGTSAENRPDSELAQGSATRYAQRMTELSAPTPLIRWLAIHGAARNRRHAAALIAEGRVSINGLPVSVATVSHDAAVSDGAGAGATEGPARLVSAADTVSVDSECVCPQERHCHVLLHKPAGYLTTRGETRYAVDGSGSTEADPRPTVYDLLDPATRDRHCVAVGRLDVDTTGALLFTSDGLLSQRLLHPQHHVSKVYRARLRQVRAKGGAATASAPLSDGSIVGPGPGPDVGADADAPVPAPAATPPPTPAPPRPFMVRAALADEAITRLGAGITLAARRKHPARQIHGTVANVPGVVGDVLVTVTGGAFHQVACDGCVFAGCLSSYVVGFGRSSTCCSKWGGRWRCVDVGVCVWPTAVLLCAVLYFSAAVRSVAAVPQPPSPLSRLLQFPLTVPPASR